MMMKADILKLDLIDNLKKYHSVCIVESFELQSYRIVSEKPAWLFKKKCK